MTIDEKIQYAEARAQGAWLFAQDCDESKTWQKALEELRAEKANPQTGR